MNDLSIDKIKNMLAAHNDGIYRLEVRDNLGDIVKFLLAKAEPQPPHEVLLDALEDLMLQADEDCPIERRSSHLSNALTQAMLLLEMSKGIV